MKWTWRILFTLLLLAGWLGLVYTYIMFTLESPTRTKNIDFVINSGATLQDIGSDLKEQGLIRDATFFRYYAWMEGITNLKPGFYVVKQQENLNQILTRLHNGDQNTVKVTIPEGKKIAEIADILGKAGLDKDGFLEKVNTKISNYSFEQDISQNKNRKYRYEGYLFPSTYVFNQKEKSDKIVKAMLDQFAQHATQLKAREKLKERGMSFDEWVTFASIVEREGQDKKEFPIIAGVIYNRLDKKMLLQVDATIAYAMWMKGVKGKVDTDFESPYNTYDNKGMPPGPIASPSKDALSAVLNPKQHDYLYYVTKSNGTGQHYFSKSLAEHNRYIQQSNKNQRAKK